MNLNQLLLETEIMNLDPQVSNCIKQCLVSEFNSSKVIIFGSYASGDATPESDVDIMAVVKDGQSSGHEATVKARIAIRKALKAIGKNMAFDLILSKQAVFDRAKLLNGTIQFVAEHHGVMI